MAKVIFATQTSKKHKGELATAHSKMNIVPARQCVKKLVCCPLKLCDALQYTNRLHMHCDMVNANVQ